MEPAELSFRLRQMASAIDASNRPSLSLFMHDLRGVLTATDKTIALKVREALVRQINQVLPGAFEGPWDTNPEGKGWRAGYISFGLKPAGWSQAGLIGGVQFRCQYDLKEFKSEEPEPGEPGAQGFKHSKGGGVFTLQIEAGYYNHKLEGSYSEARPLGSATVMVDEKENVVTEAGKEAVELSDPAGLKSGVVDLIKSIEKDPPEAAKGAALRKKGQAPTGSSKSLMEWLDKQGRDTVYRSELEALARAMSGKSGRPYGQVLEKVMRDFAYWKRDDAR